MINPNIHTDELLEQLDSIGLIVEGIKNSIHRGNDAMFVSNSREFLTAAKWYGRIAATYKEILDQEKQAAELRRTASKALGYQGSNGNGRHG